MCRYTDKMFHTILNSFLLLCLVCSALCAALSNETFNYFKTGYDSGSRACKRVECALNELKALFASKKLVGFLIKTTSFPRVDATSDI